MTYFSDIGSFVLPERFDGSFINKTVSLYPNESYYTLWFSRIVWDPRCYTTMWLGNKNKLWRSTDDGANFQAMFTDPDTNAWVEHIEISRSNPDVIYFTDHNSSARVYRSTDGGKHFAALPKPTGVTDGEFRISNIALSESNEN